MNDNSKRNCANCGRPLAEAEAAFGVRLCERCSSDQAAKAPHVDQRSHIQRTIMTAGILGFVFGANGEGTLEVAGSDGVTHEAGSFDAGGFDAGGGGGSD